MTAWDIIGAVFCVLVVAGLVAAARLSRHIKSQIGTGPHRRLDTAELLRVGAVLDSLTPGWRERGTESEALQALLDSRLTRAAIWSDHDPVVIHELGGAWRWTGRSWVWFGAGSHLCQLDVLVSVDGSDARTADTLDLCAMLFSSRNRLAVERLRVIRRGDEIDVLVRQHGRGGGT